MDNIEILISIIVIGVLVIIFRHLRSPFHYPYFVKRFDVSGKKQPQIEDLVDCFLIRDNFELIKEHHEEKLQYWKQEWEDKIEKSWLKNLRIQQYGNCIDDDHEFNFILTRKQTRYKQQNYVKSPYKVDIVDKQFACDYAYLKNRYEKLQAINFECTLREYNSKNQRKLMTKELRRKVMIRDNYTCQICGKYMPDEVGLQIDHIVPVAKGGKTVLSNLQVLCSKCNGRKSNKL